jgi:hypothetical protein
MLNGEVLESEGEEMTLNDIRGIQKNTIEFGIRGR